MNPIWKPGLVVARPQRKRDLHQEDQDRLGAYLEEPLSLLDTREEQELLCERADLASRFMALIFIETPGKI